LLRSVCGEKMGRNEGRRREGWSVHYLLGGVKNLRVIGLLLAFASSCFLVSEDEVARVISPDGRVDAILIETNGGATTSFGYRVLLARHGFHWRLATEVAALYGAVRSETAYGANLRWRSPNQLAVEYLEADEARVFRADAFVGGITVRTTLASGVSDPTAPPGGMLYNLEGRPFD